MKVLIVDDSRIMRNIVKNTLTNVSVQQWDCLEASNGLEALSLIERENFDLILVDWNMPELNGLGLVKQLRSDLRFQKLPVLMITSEAAKYNVIEAIKAGVNDYLVKPVTDKALAEKIRRLGF